MSGRTEPESELDPEPDVLEPDSLELELEPEPEPLLEAEPLPESPSPAPEPVSPPASPPDAAFTSTVPFMNGCGVQMYWNVPAVSKVSDRLLPLPNVPVSKLPSSAVAEWATSSLFLHVTVSPTSTVIDFGENAKFSIVTVVEAAAVAIGPTFCGRRSLSAPRSCSAGGCAGAGG